MNVRLRGLSISRLLKPCKCLTSFRVCNLPQQACKWETLAFLVKCPHAKFNFTHSRGKPCRLNQTLSVSNTKPSSILLLQFLLWESSLRYWQTISVQTALLLRRRVLVKSSCMNVNMCRPKTTGGTKKRMIGLARTKANHGRHIHATHLHKVVSLALKEIPIGHRRNT